MWVVRRENIRTRESQMVGVFWILDDALDYVYNELNPLDDVYKELHQGLDTLEYLQWLEETGKTSLLEDPRQGKHLIGLYRLNQSQRLNEDIDLFEEKILDIYGEKAKESSAAVNVEESFKWGSNLYIFSTAKLHESARD